MLIPKNYPFVLLLNLATLLPLPAGPLPQQLAKGLAKEEVVGGQGGEEGITQSKKKKHLSPPGMIYYF